MGRPQAIASSPLSQLTASASLPSWDGKCRSCRQLMSRCTCFQETETEKDGTGDREKATKPVNTIADAIETRPLWNALRKMHRTAAVTRLSKSSSSHSSSSLGGKLRETYRKSSSAALPPLSVPPPPPVVSTARSWPQDVQRRKERLQRGGSSSTTAAAATSTCNTSSSSFRVKKEMKKDAGVRRSMRSSNSTDKHSTSNVYDVKEKFDYGPEAEIGFTHGSDEGTVWEL